MDTIEVFEYETLKKGSKLTEEHLSALQRFLGENDEKKFPYYSLIHNGVKFKQFVGVLCVGDLTIEVLPKTDKGKSDYKYWRDNLISMLSKVYKLEVKSPSSANQKIKTNSAILDVFIKRFLDEADALLNRGLVKCYHKEDGNRNSMKGKLLVNQQLQRNCVHKERFYVRYITYDYEHVMNRILRQALVVVPQVTQNQNLFGRASSLLFAFPKLQEIAVDAEMFEKLQFDRKTEDYRDAIALAKLLLLHFVPHGINGKEDVLALMFDMDKLWEEYVFVMLRRLLRNDFNVKDQERHLFWTSSSGNDTKQIRPDIVVRRNNSNDTFVLDTKWKCPNDGKPSDGDLHQMFVYQQLFQAKKVAMIYPSTNEQTDEKDGVFFTDLSQSKGPQCDMLFLPVKDTDSKWLPFVNQWLI